MGSPLATDVRLARYERGWVGRHGQEAIRLRREGWSWIAIGKKLGGNSGHISRMMKTWSHLVGVDLSDLWRWKGPHTTRNRPPGPLKATLYPDRQPARPYPEAVAVPLDEGFVAWIDPEDADRVLAYRWASVGPRSPLATVYARCRGRATQADGTKAVALHRFILAAPRGLEVDHIDRHGLNNTRANLRFVTSTENKINSVRRNTSTGYRGVRSNGGSGTFRAMIKVSKKYVYLGSYKTAEEAAAVYDTAALHHYGEFAIVNFPDAQAGDASRLAPHRTAAPRAACHDVATPPLPHPGSIRSEA